MSINSSPFHAQSQVNYKLNYIPQDYYSQESKDIYNNNPMSNSMNLYNQYHSPLSVISKDEINPQLFTNLSNKEKRNEIELNILIKNSENNSKIEIN